MPEDPRSASSFDPSAARGRENRGQGRRLPPVIALGIGVAAVVVVLAVAQLVPFTPLDPIRLQPQTITAPDLWIGAVYGTETTASSGNTSASGTTLQVNSINSDNSTTVSWSIPFNAALDIQPRIPTFSLYLPSYLFFASTKHAMNVTVGGQTFSYTPQNTTRVPWYPTPVYVPYGDQLHPLPPPPYSSGVPAYLVFPFPSSSVSTSVPVTVTLPAHAQLSVPTLAVVANGSLSTYQRAPSIAAGALLLGVSAGVGAILVLVSRRVWIEGATLFVLVGGVIRLAVAPLFLHPDIVTLTRYDALIYNAHLVNLQSFVYGVEWLFQLALPPSAFYAAGISPTVDAYDVLLKLPAILSDLFAFLVLARLLRLRLPDRDALRWAAAGWLFNPLVIYFSAAHGLYESTVALFLLVTAYALLADRRNWAIVAQSLSVLTILPMVVTIPIVLAYRRMGLVWRATLVLAPPLAYLAAYAAIYRTIGTFPAYLQSVVGGRSLGTILPGANTLSPMSYLWLAYHGFGIYVSSIVGVAAVLGFLALLIVLGRPLSAFECLLGLYGAVVAFYFTYPVFYIQHVIWVLPLVVALLAFARATSSRALAFVWGISLLGFAVNELSFWWLAVTPYLATVFFALLPIPLLLAMGPSRAASSAVRIALRWARYAAVGATVAIAYEAFATWGFEAAPILTTLLLGAVLLARIRLVERPPRWLARFSSLPTVVAIAFAILSPVPVHLFLRTGDLATLVLAAGVFLVGLVELGGELYRYLRAPVSDVPSVVPRSG